MLEIFDLKKRKIFNFKSKIKIKISKTQNPYLISNRSDGHKSDHAISFCNLKTKIWTQNRF